MKSTWQKVCPHGIALIFLLTVLAMPMFGDSLSLTINGVFHRRVDTQSILERSRERPVDETLVNSLPLEELLPLFRSLDSITVTKSSSSSPSLILEPGESETVLPLYRSYLTAGKDGNLALLTPEGKRIEEIKEIAVSGELLEEGELEIWVAWEGVRELKEEISRWGELHNIPLQVHEVPKSDTKLLSVLRGGGKPPDIIMIQSDYLPALTAARALQPMVRFPVDTFSEKGKEAFTREGQLWAVPFYFDAQLLFYRSDLMANPNRSGSSVRASSSARSGGSTSSGSWDLPAFEAVAEQLLDRGISPASWNAYSAYWLIPFQLGFGKKPLMDSTGAISVDDRATIKAVSYLKELSDRGILDLRERDSMFSRFISGDVAMILSGSFSIPELERIGIPFGVAPFPEGPEGPVSPLLDFKGFSVTRKSRYPLLARRFLLSMSDPAIQFAFTNQVHKLPVTEAGWELTSRENRYYEVLRHSYENGTVVPSSKGYTVYKNTMWKMLRFFLNGQMPIETGLQKAQDLINNNLR